MKKIILTVVVLLVVLGAGAFLLLKISPSVSPTSPLPQVSEEQATSTPLVYESHHIVLKDKTFSLTLPTGFDIAVVAEGLGRARFMAMSPDDRLFVTDMKDLSDNSQGKIYVFADFNAATKKFGSKTTYLSGLRNPNSVAFYKDSAGVNWLYVALTDKLVRYKYTFGETQPTSAPETLATFPDYGLSYKYGGWHLTRTVIAHNDKIYVSVGSSCNSCEEKEEVRASVVEMNPDGSGQKIIAKGLRNAVGVTEKGSDLFVTGMGVDHLGNDRPEETLYKIVEGTNYGWPYCYQYQGAVYADSSKVWKKAIDCTTVPLALATFPAHAAPLGVAYFATGSSVADSSALSKSFLVALHGSSDVSLAHGYRIAQADEHGNTRDFITGFLKAGVRYGRPAGILKDSENSFFFTDDFGGVLYYVYKK